MNRSALGICALLVVLWGASGYHVPQAAAASSGACLSSSAPFSVTQAEWGTSGSQQSVYPGDQDVPLTVTMLFSGPCSSPQATFILSLAEQASPVPFTGQDGTTQPRTVALDISPNTLVTETFYLNVDPRATTGVTYRIPMIIEYDNNTIPDLVTQATRVPIALYGPVELAFGLASSQLLAGTANNVTITAQNLGSAAAGTITPTVTAPAGVTLLSLLSPMDGLASGGESSQVLRLFVPASMAGTSFTLTVSASYLDAYSNRQTTTQTLGFYVVSAPEPFLTFTTTGSLVAGQTESLNVTVTNEGPGNASSIRTSVALPAGFVLTSGLPLIAGLAPGSSRDATIGVYAPASSAGTAAALTFTASFTDPYGGSQSATQTTGVAVVEAPAPWLEFEESSGPLVAGGVDSVPVTILNAGNGEATLVRAETSTSQASVLEQLPQFGEVAPGSSVSGSLLLYVPSGMAGGALTLDISVTYTASGVTTTTTQTLGLYVADNSTHPSASLSATSLSDSVTAGADSQVSFKFTDTGNSSIYSPTFSISVPDPLVVSENASYSADGLSIGPGESQVFTAWLTASPTASIGIYQGTLRVSFYDKQGAPQTRTFDVAVKLEGSVLLLVQDERFSQNATDLTVTGNLLDEGSSPAFYAEVTGNVNGSGASQTDYIGEVSVGSPVPFSVTIPFQAHESETGNVTLVVGYKNGLGQPESSSSSSGTKLLGASALQSVPTTTNAPSSGGPSTIQLAIAVTALLVVAGVGAVAVAKRRGGKAGKKPEPKIS